MKPLIVRSDLTNSPQWYVLTRYRQKEGGIDSVTGERRAYLVAQTKYDVTEQMVAILEADRLRQQHRKSYRKAKG